MPRQKDLKRLVRARMEKTGEAYTTARAQVLRKPRTPKRSEAAIAIVAVGFYAKGTDKSSVQLEQARLPDRETAEALKQRWSERLDALREELER